MPLRLLFCTRYGTCEHPPKAVYCSEKPHSLHLQHRLQNLSGLCARARAQRLLYKLLSTTYSTTLHCFTLYSLNCSLYGFISHATCAPFSSPHKHVKYKATGHYVRLHDTCIREETHIRLFTVLTLLFLTSNHASAATTHRLPTNLSHTPCFNHSDGGGARGSGGGGCGYHNVRNGGFRFLWRFRRFLQALHATDFCPIWGEPCIEFEVAELKTYIILTKRGGCNERRTVNPLATTY